MYDLEWATCDTCGCSDMCIPIGEPYYILKGKQKRKYTKFLCKECGNTSESRCDWLVGKGSCGCIRKTSATHGLSYSKEYKAWQAIKDRCLNEKSASWHRYGGLGIKICSEWINSFEEFYKHIGPAPSLTHSVDRINTFGNYEPGNVKWSKPSEQSQNRRMFKKNKSGVAGVFKRITKTGVMWIASVILTDLVRQKLTLKHGMVIKHSRWLANGVT